ncbi:paraquat-inducible protein A [Occallatibacter savannae]|uniref:paraquat-inducible protein A n=1 Tax=Occallatibacter savannae TaxID=1002691 RepID=UPI0013A59871|nr:paraquat-inducible protein A [Occallatibacter savannae]
MRHLAAQPNPPSRERSRWYFARLAVSAVLLLPAIWFTWQTVDGLSQRRDLRVDLAELQHVRYGILSADRWRGIIGPILNAQVDKLDLQAQSRGLRPMVEHSLNNLLDNIQKQMTAPKPAAGKPATGVSAKPAAPGFAAPPMLVNMIVNSLRPHIPEYTNVVMAEIAKPQNQNAFKESIRTVLNDAVKNTFSSVDMTTYNAILRRYGCANGAECEPILSSRIQQADGQLTRDYIVVLASAALAFILLAATRAPLSRSAVVVLMLFCLAMLVGGVLSPMLEVEVRVTRLDATLLGSPIEFRDQSLYYRSKTVLEVSRSLLEMRRPAMSIVAVLVILFSVVFPALKMLALSASLFRPSLLRNSRIVTLLAFDLSKWSMADVMVLAIFMSFIAFNGVIESGMGGIRSQPAIQQLVLPTDSSTILPGYYLFIGFCISSILLSKKLERGIASRASQREPLIDSGISA